MLPQESHEVNQYSTSKIIRFNTFNANYIDKHNTNRLSSMKVLTMNNNNTNHTFDSKHLSQNIVFSKNSLKDKIILNNSNNKKDIKEYHKNISNPFEIDPEDLIFNVMKMHNAKQKKKKNKKIKKTQQSHNNIKLQSLYQTNAQAEIKLEELKKKKKKFTLVNYQNRLLNVMSNSLSKDAIDKLHKTFYSLRSSCNKQYETNITELNILEATEEKIINKANRYTRIFNNIMNNYDNKRSLKGKLPELQFENIIGKATQQMFYQKIKKKKIRLKVHDKKT